MKRSPYGDAFAQGLEMKLHGLLLSAGVALAIAGSAHASTRISDSLTVYDPNGGVFAQAIQLEKDESPSNVLTVNVEIDPTMFGNPIVLTENHGKTNSDIVGICACDLNGDFFLGFASDSETQGVNFGSFPQTSPEKGRVNVTQYLSPRLQDAGYTAWFISDSDVPEPATWAMMLAGAGLVGAGLRMERRRSATASA